MGKGIEVTIRQNGPVRFEFSLALDRGRTLALIGPSGAGKTTVLRCIAGLYRPAAGSIRCRGQVWFDSVRGTWLPARVRPVGFVFQSYALFPHMTAIENVMEAMLDLPAASRWEQAMRLLAEVHLDGLERRRPAELSGGQQQRVALARALARKPEVLLLDEPFSAVDYPTRRSLHRLLGELRAYSDIPIILVSHDISDVVQVADELCFVRDGKSIEHGAGHDLLNDPASQLARWLAGEG